MPIRILMSGVFLQTEPVQQLKTIKFDFDEEWKVVDTRYFENIACAIEQL